MAIECLFVIAILLSGSLTAAQDQYVRNFQVVSQNSTNITFSWDIVDGYYTSSYISYFYINYRHRSSTQSLYIGYSSATRSGATFRYTSSLESFRNRPYMIWVQVYRPSLDPRYTYSSRKYVNISNVNGYSVLELKVHLQPTQTCSDILSSFTQTRREVNWILRQSCSQCTFPNDLSVLDGFITCTTSDYFIFRVTLKLSTHDQAIDLTSFKDNLANFLTKRDKEARITIKEVECTVKPGQCGLIVPHLNSPHCSNDTHGSVDNASPQDNTAVITTVAIMCTAMLILVLSTCIVFLVMEMQKIKHRQAKTAGVKATHDLEMTSEGHSRSIPLPRGHDRV